MIEIDSKSIEYSLERLIDFLQWLGTQATKLHPNLEWLICPFNSEFISWSPDKATIKARQTQPIHRGVIADILWIVAERFLQLPACDKERTAKVLLDKIVSSVGTVEDGYPRLFIDDSFCEGGLM